MQFFKILFLSLITIMAFGKLEIEISPKEVVLGSQFEMTVRFNYNGENDPFVSFDPRNAEVIDSSSSASIRAKFSGGKLVQSKRYEFRYVLEPVKSGYVHLRNIRVDLGGKVIKERSRTVKVLSRARRAPDYQLIAEVDKETAFVGERIALNYYLYFKGQISQPTFNKFPKLKDFLKRFEMPRANTEMVTLNGQSFRRILLYKAVVFPQKSGSLTVDPAEVSFQYPQYKRRSRDVFGMSLSFSSGSYKTKKIRSKRVKIKVEDIPVANMPKNFTGLVGDHEFKLTFTRDKILVNDVIEAKMVVEGVGALEKFDPPKILTSNSFEEFEAKTEIVDSQNLKSSKIIDYTYLGKKSIKLEESTIKLSVFDPANRKFVEKSIVIPAIQVLGTGSSTEVLSNNTNIQTEKKTSTSVAQKEKLPVVAPIGLGKNKSSKLTNLNLVNIVLTIIIVLLLLSNFSLSSRAVNGGSTFKDLKKNFGYKTLHNFINAYCIQGVTLREKIDASQASMEAKKYLHELLDKAQRNEYKSKGDIKKTKLNAKYLSEFLK